MELCPLNAQTVIPIKIDNIIMLIIHAIVNLAIMIIRQILANVHLLIYIF